MSICPLASRGSDHALLSFAAEPFSKGCAKTGFGLGELKGGTELAASGFAPGVRPARHRRTPSAVWAGLRPAAPTTRLSAAPSVPEGYFCCQRTATSLSPNIRRTDASLNGFTSMLRGKTEMRDAFKRGEQVIHLANGMLHLETSPPELREFSPATTAGTNARFLWLKVQIALGSKGSFWNRHLMRMTSGCLSVWRARCFSGEISLNESCFSLGRGRPESHRWWKSSRRLWGWKT